MKGHKGHHHKKAKGGAAMEEGWEAKDKAPSDVYAGKGSNVVREAEERKHGGKVKRKHGGKVHGEEAKERLDRPGRKTGGRVGSERSPLSGASRVTNRPGGKLESED